MTCWKSEVQAQLKSNGVAYLRIKANPGSAKTAVTGVLEDEERTLKISVAAPPEKGKANAALLKFLGKELGCTAQVAVGGQSAYKLIKLTA